MQKTSEDLKLNIDEMDVVSGGVTMSEEEMMEAINYKPREVYCPRCGTLCVSGEGGLQSIEIHCPNCGWGSSI